MREDTDPGGSTEREIPFALNEPPGMRERLIQEIKFLISHLHEK